MEGAQLSFAAVLNGRTSVIMTAESPST